MVVQQAFVESYTATDWLLTAVNETDVLIGYLWSPMLMTTY